MTEHRRKILKKVGNVAIAVITVIAVLLEIALLVSRITGKFLIPYQILWVLTDSMEDTIPAKSIILTRSVEAKDVEEGDIISFRSRDPALGGSLNSHRVKEVIGDHEKFVTQGDHYASPDAYEVYAEDVVARYVCNLSVLTFFGRLYSTPAGLIVTLAVLMVAMNIWIRAMLRKLKKEDAASKEKEIQRRIAEEVEWLKEANIPLPQTPTAAKAEEPAPKNGTDGKGAKGGSAPGDVSSPDGNGNE